MADEEKMPEQVNKIIKTVLKETVSQQQQKAFEKLREDCELFIDRVDRIVKRNTQKGRLIERVKFLGQLFHGENATQTQVADLVKIGHEFENALNKYMGRQIPITLVSKVGNINIFSEKTTIDVYKKATADRKGNRGYISNYNQEVAVNRLHNPALTKVQKDLDKSIKNRKAVFGQALERLRNSKNMDYAKTNQGLIPNLFWIIDKAHHKNWTQKSLANTGYIGQGYVSLALQTQPPAKLITYQHNPMIYVEQAEQQIRLLSERAEHGDTIPGILQGDVKVKEGEIQLAVKQGTSFRTAGIGTNFSIAYAILHFPQNELIMPQDLQLSLQSITENISGSWQAVYKVLTGQLINSLSQVNIIKT